MALNWMRAAEHRTLVARAIWAMFALPLMAAVIAVGEILGTRYEGFTEVSRPHGLIVVLPLFVPPSIPLLGMMAARWGRGPSYVETPAPSFHRLLSIVVGYVVSCWLFAVACLGVWYAQVNLGWSLSQSMRTVGAAMSLLLGVGAAQWYRANSVWGEVPQSDPTL